jgi:hypothetical protein
MRFVQFSIILTLFIMMFSSANPVLAQVTSNFSGVFYGDYYYNVDNNVPAEKDRNAFTYRRIYFTFDNSITPDIKIRFRLESESGKYGTTSKINPFLKHAYLEWSNLIPRHVLYFGIEETNAFKNSEDWWAYRSIEKTIMDLNSISSSADFGVAVKGDIDAKYLHHWLTLMNGGGYSAAEGDRYKKIGYALWITPVNGLMIEGYVDYEKQNPKDPQTATVMSAASDYTGSTSYNTLKGFIGYNHPRFTVGAETFLRTNVKSGIENAAATYDSTANKYRVTTSSPADVQRFGYSVFGSWITPVPKLKVFARYDYYDNNNADKVYTKFDEKTGKFTSGLDDENTLIIAGLDYIPAGNVHIMPNILIKQYTKEGAKNDVVARLTIYLKYDSGKIVTQ